MSVLILDPSCDKAASHHMAIDLALLARCRDRGLAAHVLYRRDADPTLRGVLGEGALFEAPGAYTRSSGDLAVLAEAYGINSLFAADLERHLGDRVGPDDLLIIHTLTFSHLLGLVTWLRGLGGRAPRCRVVLRFPPAFRLRGAAAELVGAVYRYAFALLGETAAPIDLFADSAILAEAYAALGAPAITVLAPPIDFSFHAQAAASGRPPDWPEFVYLGEPRPEKGFALVQQAAATVARRLPEARFTVQTVGLDPGRIDWPAEARPRTRFITRNLLPPEYHRVMAASAIVLAAYDPDEYRLRTSHVFVEALGHGRPVVTTRRSWMAAELDGIAEPVAVLCDFSAGSLADAMLEAAARRAELEAAGARLAPAWRERHSFEHFAAALIG